MDLKVKYQGREYADASAGLLALSRELGSYWDGQVHVVAKELKEYLRDVARTLRAKHSGRYPNSGGSSLNVRTGRGMASILRSVSVTGTTWETLSGTIGGNRTLMIHETGGTIVARKQFLTIPLPAALDSKGVELRPARDWSDTFVGRSQAGNLLIFQRRGGGIVPLYVLKSRVYIPPRLGMRKTLTERMPYYAQRIADAVVRDFEAQLGG